MTPGREPYDARVLDSSFGCVRVLWDRRSIQGMNESKKKTEKEEEREKQKIFLAGHDTHTSDDDDDDDDDGRARST